MNEVLNVKSDCSQILDVALTTLGGTLPPEWGSTPDAFPSLRIFNASQTQLTGPMPSAWGTAGAFPKMTNLTLVNTRLNGTLPDSWAGRGIWPSLLALQVDQTDLSGDASSVQEIFCFSYLCDRMTLFSEYPGCCKAKMFLSWLLAMQHFVAIEWNRNMLGMLEIG